MHNCTELQSLGKVGRLHLWFEEVSNVDKPLQQRLHERANTSLGSLAIQPFFMTFDQCHTLMNIASEMKMCSNTSVRN